MVRVTRKKAAELSRQDSLYPRDRTRLLGTTEQYLLNEVWHGNLRAVGVGNDIVRFRRADVLEWLSARERPARPPVATRT